MNRIDRMGERRIGTVSKSVLSPSMKLTLATASQCAVGPTSVGQKLFKGMGFGPTEVGRALRQGSLFPLSILSILFILSKFLFPIICRSNLAGPGEDGGVGVRAWSRSWSWAPRPRQGP